MSADDTRRVAPPETAPTSGELPPAPVRPPRGRRPPAQVGASGPFLAYAPA